MPNESKPVVLVADDEPSMVAMLSSHLRSKGYTVLEASDGDQAWELAHEHLPNLVLLDVMMPGMSGWEVCRKIREAVSLAHTGVIMLTGIGENLNEMTSPLYGADAYLDKPFEFSDLDQKISETITRRADGALGRADGNEQERVVKKTSRALSEGKRSGKAKPEVAEKSQLPDAKPGKKAAAPKAEPVPEPKPDAKAEPKPALAKAVARPAPKPEKLVAKTKVKAAPPPKAAAKLAQPLPKAAKPAPKASKPIAKANPKPLAKPAPKAAKKSERKPVKASPKPAPKPPKQPPKPAKKAAQKRSPTPAKPAPKSVKNAAPSKAKKAAKLAATAAKKTTKKR